MAITSSSMTSLLVPGAAVLSRPSEAGEMTIASSSKTSQLIPGAAVLSCPSEAGEMAAFSSTSTSIPVPVAAVFSQPLQSLNLSILGCPLACVWTPSARVSSLTGPFHDFQTAVSSSVLPEECKWFSSCTFIFKIFLRAGNRRSDTFHTCDLFEMWVYFVGSDE